MNPHPQETPSDDTPSTGVPSSAGGQLHSKADTPRVNQSEKQTVSHALQAAQLEHKSTTSLVSKCALAEGDTPQTPREIKDSTRSAKPKPTKKKRPKKRDNHVSVRFHADELDIVTRRMERTGETQSEAVRNIVIESEEKTGNVTLTPKAPPEHLEDMLGLLGAWRRAFSTAKPRLNIATPSTDDPRYAEVKKWRAEADRLLAEIPILETVVSAALKCLTSLTPERIVRLRKRVRTLEAWKLNYEQDEKTQTMANFCQDLIDLLKDAGIEQEEGK